MAKTEAASNAATPFGLEAPPDGAAWRVVTRLELENLLVQLSPAARASILYIPGEDDGPGHVQFPLVFEAEVLAADLADGRPALVAHARALRWQAEIRGITISGVPVATDDRSKLMIIGARVAAEANPAWSTVWQGSDGHAYPVDAGTMIAISDAVHQHVNATFATLATVLASIDAGTITTLQQIDAAFAG